MSLRRQTADSPPTIEWRSDDGSTLVSVPAGVLDRIAGHVAETYQSVPRRAEAGGLLIGGVRIGAVTEIFITGFEPVACDYLSGPSFILSDAVRAEFRARLARQPAAEILGYYRSHTRAGFLPEASDRELVARIFPGMSGLILLIKASSGPSFSGSYFFFERGTLQGHAVGPEFPFTGSIPGGAPAPGRTGPPEPIQESLELAAPAPQGRTEDNGAVEAPESRKRRQSLQWELVAAGLMIAAALALLWWQYRGDNAGEDRAASRPAAAHVASLGLAVQPGEGGWRITWDPNTQAARTSVRGALNVMEVDSHERIPLNAQQIRDGAVTYRPIGDDIIFRLELTRSDNSLSTETYRVLLKPAETPAIAPPVARPVVKKAPKPEQKPESAPQEGYVEPEVVSRVAPVVPEGIRPRITSRQPMDVRVSINSEGRVTSAVPLQHGEGLINYLGVCAVAAARQWTFTPARQGGKPVASSRIIHFVFEQ